MDTATTRRAVAILGAVLAGLVLLLGDRMRAESEEIRAFEDARQRGLTPFDDAIVAIELARTAADLRLVIGEDPEDRARISAVQRLDSWFVPAYAGLFLVLVWLARRRGSGAETEAPEPSPPARGRPPKAPAWMAGLAAGAVVVAAAFDLAENRAILDALGPGGVPEAAAAAIRGAALVKWSAFYLAAGLIGLLLMTRRYRSEAPRFVLAVAGNLFLLAALFGLGVWIVPSFVGAGTWWLVVAVPLLLGIVLARPGVLDEPLPAPRPATPPEPARSDLLLALTRAAEGEIGRDPGGPLGKALGCRLVEYVGNRRRRPLPCVHDEPAGGDVSPEVRRELLADLLVTERLDDARRLARAAGAVPPSIDRLSAAVVERLRSEEDDGLGAILAAHGIEAPRPRDDQEWALAHDSLRVELLLRPSLAARLAERVGAAVPFALAQQAELDEVRSSREARGLGPPAPAGGYAPRRALDLDLAGLALSGGGIRSATFNLGVLQALADLRLLHRIDYLSTVSGGGYVGSWLVSWAKRRERGIRDVQERLSPQRSPDPNAPGVRPIRFLREYSNYLAPRRGLLGPDTWTLLAIWLRNTFLVQSVLVLFLGAILLLPRLVGLLARSSTSGPEGEVWGMTALGLWVFLVLCLRTGTELGRFTKADAARVGTALDADWAPPSKAGPGQVQATIVLPGFAVGMLLAIPLWRWASLEGGPSTGWLAGYGGPVLGVGVFAALLFAIGVLVVEVRAGYARGLLGRSRGATAWTVGLVVIALATLVPAASGGALVAGLASLFLRWASVHDLGSAAGTWHVIALGPPSIIGILGLSLMLHIGLIGRNLDDDRREWTSRLGAWLLIWSVAWLATFGLAVYGPYLLTVIERRLAAAGGLAWLASAGWGAWTAQSPSGPSAPGRRGPSGGEGWVSASRDAAVRLAPFVFVAGLLVLISWGLHLLLLRASAGAPGWSGVSWSTLHLRHWQYMNETALGWAAGLLAALVAATLLLAWRVDVNEFSLHHLYKNRLVRCYLGASRQADGRVRRAHPFTGFDREDDLPLASLRVDPPGAAPTGGDSGPAEKEGYRGPFPIVATALNLVKGEDLAWQERKAQSFMFTPLYSGYDYAPAGPPRSERSPHLASHALRPTPSYGYPPEGIHLGTAFAISGAAASPNMGYHSSPAAGFLMTMFNVRLGWWMGNPRHEGAWRQASPTLGLSSLVRELTGATTNTSAFVNLSDGGHFENLGLYELVRRRCRFIIAGDAEQDGELTFGGLGNAIRKCRTDFGVEIRIRPDPIRARDEATRRSKAHAVMGDVLYPGGDRGLLCYLKSSLAGDEPGDVLEYALRVAEFPHESTADQFFDESQFESYRQLGHHVAHRVLGVAVHATGDAVPDDEFWRTLFRHLVPARPKPGASVASSSPPLSGGPGSPGGWAGVERRSGVDRRRGPTAGPERRSGTVA